MGQIQDKSGGRYWAFQICHAVLATIRYDFERRFARLKYSQNQLRFGRIRCDSFYSDWQSVTSHLAEQINRRGRQSFCSSASGISLYKSAGLAFCVEPLPIMPLVVDLLLVLRELTNEVISHVFVDFALAKWKLSSLNSRP